MLTTTEASSAQIALKTIRAEPLTPEGFAPFGEVIEVRDSANHFPINYGYGERFHELATADTSDHGGRTVMGILQAKAMAMPLVVKTMERHPMGSQAFIPLSVSRYLIIVAEKGEFCPQKIKAFYGESHQGVNYFKGTWHHFCAPLSPSCNFLMIDREGPGNNCDEVQLEPQDWLQVELDFL